MIKSIKYFPAQESKQEMNNLFFFFQKKKIWPGKMVSNAKITIIHKNNYNNKNVGI